MGFSKSSEKQCSRKILPYSFILLSTEKQKYALERRIIHIYIYEKNQTNIIDKLLKVIELPFDSYHSNMKSDGRGCYDQLVVHIRHIRI